MAEIIKFPESSEKTTLTLSCVQQEIALVFETVGKIEPIFVLLKHMTQDPLFPKLELNDPLLAQLNSALQKIASVLQERNLSLRLVLEDMNMRL